MTFNNIINIPIIKHDKIVEKDFENKVKYTKEDSLRNIYRAKRSNIINKGKKNGRNPR